MPGVVIIVLVGPVVDGVSVVVLAVGDGVWVDVVVLAVGPGFDMVVKSSNYKIL